MSDNDLMVTIVRNRELPICICGEEVAVPHKECLATMTQREHDWLRRVNGGGSDE